MQRYLPFVGLKITQLLLLSSRVGFLVLSVQLLQVFVVVISVPLAIFYKCTWAFRPRGPRPNKSQRIDPRTKAHPLEIFEPLGERKALPGLFSST